MPLLQIQEPTKPAKACAIGIDLGTTHSLVGVLQKNKIVVLADDKNEVLLPSVVRYLPNGEVVVGKAAKAAFSSDPQNTIMSVKRLMGRTPQDISAHPALTYNFSKEITSHCALTTVVGNVDAVQVSAEILKVLLKRAHQLDPDIHEAVITVPAYFDDAQRQATLDAARLAGIKVLRLLNEPTAAALAYGLDKATVGTCLVFDLGGGTFDVSLLQLSQGFFEVLATRGDTALGGDDIDRLIVNWILQHLESNHVVNQAELLLIARNAKETLSEHTTAKIQYQGWEGELTLATFNQLIHPLILRTLAICEQVLKDAKMTQEKIQHIVLVGGMTRAIYVRQQVAAFFGKAPLTDIDPESVIAIGATVQASILSGDPTFKNTLLLDVIPLSLGIEMMGGVVEKILMRNTPIPAQATQLFTTYQDGQTGLSLHVVQGERELAKDCRSLAHFYLKGLPPMSAGKARIEVTFCIDCDGLLSVEAIEKGSGIKSAIEVKATYGLNEQTINQLIEEAIANVDEDLLKRKLYEKVTEAEHIIKSLSKAIKQENFSTDTQKAKAVIKSLSMAIQRNQLNEITQTLKAVEGTIEAFALNRLNQALEQAFVGKTLEETNTS